MYIYIYISWKTYVHYNITQSDIVPYKGLCFIMYLFLLLL